ncbi:MAG: M28 family peptidase [Candidatus Lokiarchaeota archaeon]|nr:M28 family peptidase [Candidatus Lokiarchaeota archaeon]
MIGEIVPKEVEPERILIFSGHHDSAYEFNLIKWGKGKYMIPLPVLALIPLFMILINSIWTLIYSLIFNSYRPNVIISLIINVPFFPFLVLFYFFTSKHAVLGAMDNLSAVSVCLGISKYLSENKNSQFYPKHTKVLFISFGSEEAALRGSKKFVSRHYDRIKNATLINFESIAKKDLIKVIKKEQTAKLSDQLCKEIIKITDQIKIKCEIRALFFGTGGTDATSFAKAGIKATTIIGQPIGPVSYYHTQDDTIDVIEKESLRYALEIALHYIKFIDNQ